MDFEEFVLAASVGDLADEERAREHADAVEFRMDLADDPLAALDDYDGELPVIATNRPTWEGGEAEEGGRVNALVEAAQTESVAAVDVELASLVGSDENDVDGDGGGEDDAAVDERGNGAEVLAAARAADTTTIVSSHDFEGTPPLSELASTLGEACSLGDVGKLAVTAEDRGDALDLLRVTHEYSAAGMTVATMAMGEAGRHTRPVAPLYGSRIGYAPVDSEDATAPGQYDAATLRRLVADLR
ncbi:type I 3-dehydroquinate dehydratase [Halobacterium litoreum]|uniref:3-dehydroquinate dehydratase n=1 Tax=Halobacterium litoreum TaxID=2039234 RepID=A0ABD5NHD0_9EURY|nr:type I 3-dehydroquinate dehydratase [Halobacterium litoreum]UHH12728.1 type I 3-dehydroquinate dehydratase [Halobacterium litoreum]